MSIKQEHLAFDYYLIKEKAKTVRIETYLIEKTRK